MLDYALNPLHPRGRHKARVFAAVPGVTRANADVLRQALLTAAATRPATEVSPNAFGKRYFVDFTMIGLGGAVVVRSTWIILYSELAPKLIGCRVI